MRILIISISAYFLIGIGLVGSLWISLKSRILLYLKISLSKTQLNYTIAAPIVLLAVGAFMVITWPIPFLKKNKNNHGELK